MTVKKLSDADKKEILKLYRETGETTSTLAERYDVSNSTISRFLKITLPEDEYETLIAAKRAARTPGGEAKQALLLSQPEADIPVVQPLVKEIVEETREETSQPTPAFKRVRRRSSAVSEPEKPLEKPPSIIATQLQLLQTTDDEIVDSPNDNFVDAVEAIAPPAAIEEKVEEKKVVPQPKRLDVSASVVTNNFTAFDKEAQAQEANTIAAILGEELLDESEDLDEDDDDDLEDLDEDDDVQEMPILNKRVRSTALIQVLPLSAAPLPKTCYLVIDRASELITRPLKDFGELGQIPTGEIQQKTLPIFDNHRVARRFSTKRDRVIKVPDSAMLQKTRSQLQAKGITRLLVDGQVYSLAPT